tara:strand:+ start:140 stop:388 length:249 start_codon:yes stop_codon:yes gene_type:complete
MSEKLLLILLCLPLLFSCAENDKKLEVCECSKNATNYMQINDEYDIDEVRKITNLEIECQEYYEKLSEERREIWLRGLEDCK